MSASVKWARAGTSVIAIVICLSFACMCRDCRVCSPPQNSHHCTRLGRFLLAEPGSPYGRSVVVPAAADGVSHPSHQHQCQADDEEDDPDDEKQMGVGEGRKEGREEESEDDEEDSEANHDVYLVSSGYGEG